MTQARRENPIRSVLSRVIVCLLILGFSAAGFVGLKSMKKPPVRADKTERPLKVETIIVEKTDVPVMLSGFGELRSIREVEISAEVAGRVVELHPDLQSGGMIPAGAVLFALDDDDALTAELEDLKRPYIVGDVAINIVLDRDDHAAPDVLIAHIWVQGTGHVIDEAPVIIEYEHLVDYRSGCAFLAQVSAFLHGLSTFWTFGASAAGEYLVELLERVRPYPLLGRSSSVRSRRTSYYNTCSYDITFSLYQMDLFFTISMKSYIGHRSPLTLDDLLLSDHRWCWFHR